MPGLIQEPLSQCAIATRVRFSFSSKNVMALFLDAGFGTKRESVKDTAVFGRFGCIKLSFQHDYLDLGLLLNVVIVVDYQRTRVNSPVTSTFAPLRRNHGS